MIITLKFGLVYSLARYELRLLASLTPAPDDFLRVPMVPTMPWTNVRWFRGCTRNYITLDQLFCDRFCKFVNNKGLIGLFIGEDEVL